MGATKCNQQECHSMSVNDVIFTFITSCQFVVGYVRMKGAWMTEAARVTVQMASVGIAVNVSTV